jgi:hypothetical protein
METRVSIDPTFNPSLGYFEKSSVCYTARRKTKRQEGRWPGSVIALYPKGLI